MNHPLPLPSPIEGEGTEGELSPLSTSGLHDQVGIHSLREVLTPSFSISTVVESISSLKDSRKTMKVVGFTHPTRLRSEDMKYPSLLSRQGDSPSTTLQYLAPLYIR